MKTIKKYELKHTVHLNLPKQAEILSIQNIEDVPVLFVKEESNNVKEIRVIGVYLTDNELPDNIFLVYLGSLTIMKKEYHFFEHLQ